MIRPVLTELVLFLTPFVLYALFLLATRAKLVDAASWPPSRLIWLTIVALVLMIGSFIGLAEWAGAPPGGEYVPARIEGGKLVPGEIK